MLRYRGMENALQRQRGDILNVFYEFSIISAPAICCYIERRRLCAIYDTMTSKAKSYMMGTGMKKM